MTGQEFLAFYPQFGGIPDIVVEEYVNQSNARYSEALDAAEEARRLYVAHKLTLYAQTAIPMDNGTMPSLSRISGAGVAAQALSKSVGGVSVSKSEGSAVSSISGYGELKLTAYGIQLISLMKAVTMGGRYIP